MLACLVLALLHAFTSNAQPVTNIVGGGDTLFLKSNASLWGMGFNYYGALGDGTYNHSSNSGTNRPEQIVASNVTATASGNYHNLFLKADGSLWGMGYNADGELGDGTYNNTNRPEQIVASNVVAMAAGYLNSLFLKRDGSLWGMGSQFYGQLGNGTYGTAPNYSTNRPVQIVGSNVTAVAAGRYHSLFIKTDGSLWGMGYNADGELGTGNYMTNYPGGTNQPMQIVTSNVIAIAAGAYHSLFLKSDGSLWAMGANLVNFPGIGVVNTGQLGDGTYNNTNLPEQIVASNVVAIAAGYYHSLFLKRDGSLWGMGANIGDGGISYGQLGDGTFNNTNRPEQIVASNVIAIAAGPYHSLFLKRDGSLWGMGANFVGWLGDGTYNNTNRPEQILAPYNQISGQLLANGDEQLFFVGIAAASYALDRSASLSPPNWISLATNPATSYGALVFTNTPDSTTNNFWRIRSLR
jgi:alpha-tubulin suppressor-like RCC1 family protein